MNKGRHHRHRNGGRRRHTAELSARLAPPEELQSGGTKPEQPGAINGDYQDGTIKIDSASVKSSGKSLTGEDEATNVFRLEPVIAVILVLTLAFIAFITWQITLMPASAK